MGTVYDETITHASFAPLNTHVRKFRVSRRESGNRTFQHLGGDDYGNFIDDIRLERL